jgi:hypothetical protein
LATLAIGTGFWPPVEPRLPTPSTAIVASPSLGQAGLNAEKRGRLRLRADQRRGDQGDQDDRRDQRDQPDAAAAPRRFRTTIFKRFKGSRHDLRS